MLQLKTRYLPHDLILVKLDCELWTRQVMMIRAQSSVLLACIVITLMWSVESHLVPSKQHKMQLATCTLYLYFWFWDYR